MPGLGAVEISLAGSNPRPVPSSYGMLASTKPFWLSHFLICKVWLVE